MNHPCHEENACRSCCFEDVLASVKILAEDENYKCKERMKVFEFVTLGDTKFYKIHPTF